MLWWPAEAETSGRKSSAQLEESMKALREKSRVTSGCLTWDTGWAGGNVDLDQGCRRRSRAEEGGRTGEKVSLILGSCLYLFSVFEEFLQFVKCYMRCWGYGNKQDRFTFHLLGVYVLVKQTNRLNNNMY